MCPVLSRLRACEVCCYCDLQSEVVKELGLQLDTCDSVDRGAVT